MKSKRSVLSSEDQALFLDAVGGATPVLGELLGALSGYVHALSTAAPADGGEGATYVMLRGTR